LIYTLSIQGYRFTFKHLCWHSITKILRNGPRAHFSFRHPALLCVHGSPKEQRPSGEGKRRNPQGTQDTHLRLLEKAWCKLGQRASVCAMGEPDHTQSSYRGDPVLLGLRGRSLPSPGNPYGLPTGLVVRRVYVGTATT
jgi:hypothetical protein